MTYLLLALLAHTPCPEPKNEKNVVAEYGKLLEIKGTEVVETWGRKFAINGELKNKTGKALKVVEFTVFALDAKGDAIWEKIVYPVFQNRGDGPEALLKPNYTTKFGVMMEQAPDEWAKAKSKKFRIEITKVVLAD